MTNRHMNPTQAERDQRRTVIPAPRTDSMFPGWGIKF